MRHFGAGSKNEGFLVLRPVLVMDFSVFGLWSCAAAQCHSDMIRRAGMLRFIELASESNIGGWVV